MEPGFVRLANQWQGARAHHIVTACSSLDLGINSAHVLHEVCQPPGVARLCRDNREDRQSEGRAQGRAQCVAGPLLTQLRMQQHKGVNATKQVPMRVQTTKLSPRSRGAEGGHNPAPDAWHAVHPARVLPDTCCPRAPWPWHHPPLSYHETSFTNVGDSWMPAPASTMDERVSPMKSVDTTASVVKLQGKRRGRGKGGRAARDQARGEAHSVEGASTEMMVTAWLFDIA